MAACALQKSGFHPKRPSLRAQAAVSGTLISLQRDMKRR
jgi:hypothetical protein